MWPTADSIGRLFDVVVSRSGYLYLGIRISTVLDVSHQIAVHGDTVFYIADTNGERLLKYVRR